MCRFRSEFYSCLGARADAQFELTEALLCADGPVRSLVDLSLAPEHRRGHGALYDGLNHGRSSSRGCGAPWPGWRCRGSAGGSCWRADVSPWLRPDAETSPDRLFCHVHGRAKGSAQMIPGWPYSIVAALGSGRSSWTAVLDAVRLGPDDDATAVTAGQLRDVVTGLIAAGHWRPGDPEIEIVLDTGYDVTRLAFVLADLPVILTGRLRSDRVMLRPAPPRRSGSTGRPPRHGPVLDLDQPATWPDPDQATTTPTTRYGLATASAWHRMHPRLARRGPWLDHPGTRTCRSSRAPWSGCRSPTCPVTAPRNRCGCGPPDPKPPPSRSTRPGRRTCAASILNTRSGSSSSSWAGPLPGCVTPPPPTAGPG